MVRTNRSHDPFPRANMQEGFRGVLPLSAGADPIARLQQRAAQSRRTKPGVDAVGEPGPGRLGCKLSGLVHTIQLWRSQRGAESAPSAVAASLTGLPRDPLCRVGRDLLAHGVS